MKQFRRYSVPCHRCDGQGNIEDFPDEDGNRVLNRCDCSRGWITFKLTPRGEQDLLEQLKKALEP